MSRTLGRRLTIGGLTGLVLGTGPLLAVIVLAPKSNAIGPGLLAFFTFWPSVACTIAGIVVWLAGRRPEPLESDRRPEIAAAYWRDQAA